MRSLEPPSNGQAVRWCIARTESRTDSYDAGSVLHLPNVPCELKDIYSTAREINPVVALDMAAERAPYIEQAEAVCVRPADVSVRLLVRISRGPSITTLIRRVPLQSVLQGRAWDAGMKTGVYCL